MADAGTWDEAMLMGIGEEGKGAEAVTKDPMLWGVPGYMTKEEADAFVSLFMQSGCIVIFILSYRVFLTYRFFIAFSVQIQGRDRQARRGDQKDGLFLWRSRG